MEAKHFIQLVCRNDMVLQPCRGVTAMNPEAPLESPSLFSEWGSWHIWSLAAGCSHELCPVLGMEQETITLYSQILLLPGLLRIPVALVLPTD